MKDMDAEDSIPIEITLEAERTAVFMKGKGTKVCKESLTALWAAMEKAEEAKAALLKKQMTLKEKKKKTLQCAKLTGK